jgi:hypothetical protein
MLVDEISLAIFHVTLANTLLQSSGLESQLSQERIPKFEEQRRLVWSIFLLDSIFGPHYKVSSFVENVYSPRDMVAGVLLPKISGQCPSLPQEPYNDEEEKSLGIWAYMTSEASLWREVRLHVSRCADEETSAPWRPDSIYTLINSHIVDFESSVPVTYRYDMANFMERSPDELSANRQYWLPWMRVQITYHAIHCVLNHPFLYSSRRSKHPLGTNAFWKTSSQLALLHSTWIARLLDMADKKDLRLSDPFFAHAAVVAATLHSYWGRATDPTISAPARKHLEICRSFVTNIGTHWPICRSMVVLHVYRDRHPSDTDLKHRPIY